MEGEEETLIDETLEVIEYVGTALEVLAVSVIVIGVAYATIMALSGMAKSSFGPGDSDIGHRSYRQRLGRTLILGLEILVAADVVRTVALEPTFQNVGILGLLVLIRTFLSWSLTVELEGRWPWQPPAHSDAATGE